MAAGTGATGWLQKGVGGCFWEMVGVLELVFRGWAVSGHVGENHEIANFRPSLN